MVNTFLKYLLISGAILTIDFNNFLSSKRIVKFIRKRLAIFIGDFYTQKHPVGASIHRRKESFPVKPSLVPTSDSLNAYGFA